MDIKENRYIDLILHTEIGKLINNNTVQHPDMVLHGGQIGPNRENNNKIFLELKKLRKKKKGMGGIWI